MTTYTEDKNESINGATYRHLEIEGYRFHATKSLDIKRESWLFQAPMGDTPYEKAMFDNLVYYNKHVYYGKDFYRVVEKIREFIINFKKQ